MISLLFRQRRGANYLARASYRWMLESDKMEIEKPAYRSFMLRLWQVEQNGDWIWRCSLEETGTGRHRSFINLEAMFGYLSAETGAPPITEEESKQ